MTLSRNPNAGGEVRAWRPQQASWPSSGTG